MSYGFIRIDDNWCIIKEINGLILVEEERVTKPLRIEEFDGNNICWLGYRLSFASLGFELYSYYNRLIEWFNNREEILEKYFDLIL